MGSGQLILYCIVILHKHCFCFLLGPQVSREILEGKQRKLLYEGLALAFEISSKTLPTVSAGCWSWVENA